MVEKWVKHLDQKMVGQMVSRTAAALGLRMD